MVNGGIPHRHSVIIWAGAQRCLVDSFVTKAQCFQYNTERNGYKMPDFHRLDMSLIFNVPHYVLLNQASANCNRNLCYQSTMCMVAKTLMQCL